MSAPHWQCVPRSLSALQVKHLAVIGDATATDLEMKVSPVLNSAAIRVASHSSNHIDVATLDGVCNWLASMIQELGDIDHAVNTAKIFLKKPLETPSIDELDKKRV